MVETTMQTGRYVNNGEESGKTRLLDFMRQNAKPNGWLTINNTGYIAKQIGLNEHEVVHLLHSLKRENLVTFREKSATRAPYRMRLTPPALGRDYAKGTKQTPWWKKHEAEINSETGEQDTISEERPAEAITEPVVESEQEQTPTEPYPLIKKLVMRRQNLLRAARLAEEGGAEDLALALYEKADAKMTPFEQEAVSLYISCQTE